MMWPVFRCFVGTPPRAGWSVGVGIRLSGKLIAGKLRGIIRRVRSTIHNATTGMEYTTRRRRTKEGGMILCFGRSCGMFIQIKPGISDR